MQIKEKVSYFGVISLRDICYQRYIILKYSNDIKDIYDIKDLYDIKDIKILKK